MHGYILGVETKRKREGVWGGGREMEMCAAVPGSRYWH